jgi:L-aminopeptidase/D-esterase-like protein
MRAFFLLSIGLMVPCVAGAQGRPRATDLGIPIGGTAGPLNAITDVAGVEVGHTTLISGTGRLVVGQGPVRTGVTVVLPRGKSSSDPVFGAWFTLNGNGEMTGTTWLQESGMLEGPVAITTATVSRRGWPAAASRAASASARRTNSAPQPSKTAST